MRTLLLSFALFATPLVANFPQETDPTQSIQHSVVASQQQPSSPDQQPSNNVMPSEEMIEEPAPLMRQSITSSMLKMITALLGILLLLVFVAWGVRRLQRGGSFSQIQINRRIKILERRPLSPKSVLYLIEYDGKRVLIAESQLEVRPLTTPDGQQVPPQAAD